MIFNVSNLTYSNNKWWVNMILINLWAKMECKWAQSNTNWWDNRMLNMETKWEIMEMRWWMIQTLNTICNKNRNQRKILYKTRSRRSFRFVLKMMLSLVTQNSQLMMGLFTMILSIHQSMLWICQWLNGKDHKKLFLRMKNQECIEMLWIQEIWSKKFLEIVISWVLCWLWVQTQSFLTT